MPQFIAQKKPSKHFESDRDVLDFPQGGVFGSAEDHTDKAIDGALSLARQLEVQLDTMQAQLDELAHEVDKSFAFPGPSATSEDTWTTPAA